MMLQSPSPARQLVEEALQLRADGKWDELVSLVHPEALANFREEQLQFISLGDVAPEGETAIPAQPSLLNAVFRVNDRAEFDALSSEEMLKRWLRVAHRNLRPDDEFVPPQVSEEILGEVTGGEKLVHVVFRESSTGGSYGGTPIPARDHVRLVTVKRDQVAWKMFLNGGIVFEENGLFGIGYDDDDSDPPLPRNEQS